MCLQRRNPVVVFKTGLVDFQNTTLDVFWKDGYVIVKFLSASSGSVESLELQ